MSCKITLENTVVIQRGNTGQHLCEQANGVHQNVIFTWALSPLKEKHIC